MDWTECNDYAAVSPVGRGLLGYDSELNPASPGSPQALQSQCGCIPSKTQAQLGVEPILRPGGVHGR